MCGGMIGFLLRTKVEIWGGGDAYLEMMYTYFGNWTFFSATDVVVGDMSVSHHKKQQEK